jgi:signal transduction histidine kinase
MEDELSSQIFNIGTHKSELGTQKEQGTGLGLILCKEFVEKHGGTIWVDSKPSVGSVFGFSIPIK